MIRFRSLVFTLKRVFTLVVRWFLRFPDQYAYCRVRYAINSIQRERPPSDDRMDRLK